MSKVFALLLLVIEESILVLVIEKTEQIIAQTKEAILTGEKIAEEKFAAAKKKITGWIFHSNVRQIISINGIFFSRKRK